MNKSIVVALSQRVDVWADRGERRDALDQRLCQWLIAAGCVPMPVPNCLVSPEMDGSDQDSLVLQNWLAVMRPEAVVLSGGNDIGEVPERDLTERRLLSWAKDRKVPVLGICRGMQMMAVWAGGALMPVEGHVRTRHLLQLANGVGGWPKEVNSFHNFALDADCPPGFEVTARAGDGVIEAICHAKLPWEGWMWHPERETNSGSADMNRLKALFHV